MWTWWWLKKNPFRPTSSITDLICLSGFPVHFLTSFTFLRAWRSHNFLSRNPHSINPLLEIRRRGGHFIEIESNHFIPFSINQGVSNGAHDETGWPHGPSDTCREYSGDRDYCYHDNSGVLGPAAADTLVHTILRAGISPGKQTGRTGSILRAENRTAVSIFLHLSFWNSIFGYYCIFKTIFLKTLYTLTTRC